MRALVISGGGCKGAFAVGAIEYFIEQFYDWDLIVGTSTGALIAPLVAAGKFSLAKYIYSNVRTKDLIKKHCWLTLPWRNSLYSANGLQQVIETHYTPEVHSFLRHDIDVPEVSVCTVNLNSGMVCYWSPKDCSREEFCRALLASANQPGLMPPIQIKKGGDYHVDGGVREVVPIAYAVEMGANEVTAIVLSPYKLEHSGSNFDNIPDILLRTLDLMVTEIREGDVTNRVNLTVVRPDDALVDNSLRFNPKEMQKMMKIGYEVAKREVFKKSIIRGT